MATQSTAAKPETSVFATIKEYLTRFREAAVSKNGKRIRYVIRLLLSILSVVYLFGIIKLAYDSVFYTLIIKPEDATRFCVRISFICLFYTIIMLVTRKQVLTRLSIMFSMPFHLFIFLFNYQHRVLIIPMAVMIVITYLFSGVKEAPKTIFGGIYVMIYIVGAYLYLTAGSMLTNGVTEKVIDTGVSALGTYRYQVIQSKDKVDTHDEGSSIIRIEPNNYDFTKKYCLLQAKGYQRDIYVTRPMTDLQLEWKTLSRQQITESLLKVSKDMTLDLNDEQLIKIGVSDQFKAAVPISETTRYQRKALGVCIAKDIPEGETAESLGLKQCEVKDEITVSFAQIREAKLGVDCKVKLADLSDGDLEALGVPALSDVLYANGKVVFRQYIAEIEEMFKASNRSYEKLILQ